MVSEVCFRIKQAQEHLRSCFPAYVISSAQMNSLKKKKKKAALDAFECVGVWVAWKVRDERRLAMLLKLGEGHIQIPYSFLDVCSRMKTGKEDLAPCACLAA